MKTESETLVKSFHSFFHIYLPKQKCYSTNTIDSYKAAFNLFLDYMMEEFHRPLYKMTLEDLNKDNLIGFLSWLSTVRKNSSSTCNQRLMAFRSFAKYLGLNDFSLASIYTDVSCVPMKKTSPKIVEYLSEEGLKTLLLQPDTSKRTETRNQFFMILMYDTAARCQELLDLRVKELSLTGGSPFVYLTGKGNKTCTVPLMHATVKHLMNYLKLFHPNYPRCGDDYLFYTISHGQVHQMSRDTVALFMKKYGESAQKICQDIPFRVHPHQIRHTRAIHLYRGGMPLALLSEFLGHVSVETTRIYAYADTEMKRNAIEKATSKTTEVEETPIWNTTDDEVLRKLAGLR